MQILILTVGTRGDVQPYIALGQGLQRSGHTVTIATSARFNALITQYGLAHAPLSVDFMALMEGTAGRAAVRGKHILALLREVRPMLRQLLDESWLAAQGANAIIYHPKALSGPHLAEKLQIPGFVAHPVPLFAATRAFPSPALPWADLGPRLNRWSWTVNRYLNGPFQGLINAWRRDTLQLPPTRNEWLRDGLPVPQVYGFSPLVVPPPADWDPATVTTTGYWFLEQPAAWQPAAALHDFLAAGPAPVYIGFGSMAAQDAERTTGVVLEALRRAQLRAVLATGVGGLVPGATTDTMFVLDDAPHDWLFPRMAAIVHHGGAGTTAAAFRAGKPQLICPFFGDQPFWGRRAAALEVGLPPIHQKHLSVARLTPALTRLTTEPMFQRRAAELGAAIRAEHGVERAVSWIDARLERPVAGTVPAPLPASA